MDVAPLCLEFRKTISASHAADKQGRTQAHGRPQDSRSRGRGEGRRRGGGRGGGHPAAISAPLAFRRWAPDPRCCTAGSRLVLGGPLPCCPLEHTWRAPRPRKRGILRSFPLGPTGGAWSRPGITGPPSRSLLHRRPWGSQCPAQVPPSRGARTDPRRCRGGRGGLCSPHSSILQGGSRKAGTLSDRRWPGLDAQQNGSSASGRTSGYPTAGNPGHDDSPTLSRICDSPPPRL